MLDEIEDHEYQELHDETDFKLVMCTIACIFAGVCGYDPPSHPMLATSTLVLTFGFDCPPALPPSRSLSMFLLAYLRALFTPL